MMTNANPAIVLPGILNRMTSELYGLSMNTKPVYNVPNGSIFLEIDTGKVFVFNGTNNQFAEFGAWRRWIFFLLLMKAQASGVASPDTADADADKVIIADAFEDLPQRLKNQTWVLLP